MTITQTVDIPNDRRVTLDFPREVPTGKARVEMRVIPFVKKDDELMPKEKNSTTPHTNALLSLLSNIGEVDIDEIRAERLAKHLK